MPLTLFLDSNTFDWWHYLEVLCGGITAFGVVGVAWWGFRREDRKAILDAATAHEAKNEQRHSENKEVIAKLGDNVEKMATLLEYHPPHVHTEKRGPLTAEGIWPPHHR